MSPHLAASMAAKREGAQASHRAQCAGVRHDLLNFYFFLISPSFQSVIVPTDDAFVTSVASYIRECASGTTERSCMYIETAGGENLRFSVSVF